MRAQTTLDFAVGMSVFLLTVAFVVSFLPAMFQPFEGGDGPAVVSGDRVADQLARRLLIAGVEPFVLDAPCTAEFFGGPDVGCGFDGDPLHEDVGLSADANVNVRLVGEDADGDGDPDLLCSDGDADGDGDIVVDETGDQSCATAFEAGDAPPDDAGSVAIARRTVSIQHRDAALLVRTW